MSTVIIGGGPRPQAKVVTRNGFVSIEDESGVIASGFYDEADAHCYLKSMNAAVIPSEDEPHADPSQT